MRRGQAGFSLIEMLTIVTVIGILSTIAIPRFAKVLDRANEGATKGNLAALRSALSIYYAETEGNYPAALSDLAVGARNIAAIPKAKLPPHHNDSSAVATGSAATDAGGWLYDDVAGSQTYGDVWVNCTHTDTHGSVWTAY